MPHVRHATRSFRLRAVLASPAAREATVTAAGMVAVTWWVVGDWAAVPLLICLTLLVTASVVFGVQVGVGLARRGAGEFPGVPEGEASVTAAGELLACLGARP
jgi:hypothetical protein